MIARIAANSVFAVRFAHPNAFGTSQTRRALYEIAAANKGNTNSGEQGWK